MKRFPRSPKVRRGLEPMGRLIEKILLATDGSENAALAATIASDLSARVGPKPHVVHVLEPFARYAYLGVTPEIYALAFDERRMEAQDLLDAQVERVRGTGAQVDGIYLEVSSTINAKTLDKDTYDLALSLAGLRRRSERAKESP